MNILLTLLGIDWTVVFAQLANLAIILLLVALPILVWKKYKKKEAIRNEQLKRIQEGVDELKAR